LKWNLSLLDERQKLSFTSAECIIICTLSFQPTEFSFVVELFATKQ